MEKKFMQGGLRFLLLILLCFFYAVQAAGATEKDAVCAGKSFARHNAAGACVIYDVQNDAYLVYNQERSGQRFYPGSTFKIFNALIGLDEGAVRDVDTVFYHYNGEKVFLESWKQDASLRSAIKISQVPAYQLLARKIGEASMRRQLQKLQYGNMLTGGKSDSFWLAGPLAISAKEQAFLLGKLAWRMLPYPRDKQRQIASICLMQEERGYKLYGKTGWATDNIAIPVGWFVGWVENNRGIYSFALNMDLPDSKDLPQREEIMREILQAYQIIE